MDDNRHDIQTTTNDIKLSHRWDHFLVRIGYKRSSHKITPGIYALGNPREDSPVFVTANYTLSFDALRSSLAGINCYILVLDTMGVNVWCAAGKGAFGTDELVHRVKDTGLKEVVSHRKLILPQLGAAGVAAHEVKKRSGFNVEYGPVRAVDLPEYLKTHKATAEMRRVKFTLRDRLILVPVELTHSLLPVLLVALILYLVGDLILSVAAAVAIFGGVALFPILLPWIPTPNFSTKGYILGALVILPFAIARLLANPEPALWQRIGWAVVYMLALPTLTAFLALNFTGSTNFTSRSGVRREIFTYIPVMAVTFGAGLIFAITLVLIRLLGGSG
ncbi:MAG: carbon monoxide dehydrogenase [Candidatus Aminicenantes bacterium]|nr:carbon monoxide dehydrogenase [Candidatus Aminicenantes bacterium]